MRHLFYSTMDAYRYFFPAGWLCGVWGVVLWILFPWHLVSYPGLKHPEIMVGGFFLCFVCGFLMTAIPKFTASFGPSLSEQRASLLLISLLILSLFPQKNVYFYLVVTGIILFLGFYASRRFLKRRSNPPDAFLFIVFGLGTAFIGSLILLLKTWIPMPQSLYQLGRLFFLQTYILCLVLGIGSRLVPALLGWGPAPTVVTKAKQFNLFFALAVMFVTTYVLEAFYFLHLAFALRFFLMAFIAFRFWKLHKWPQRKAFQSFWIWCSAWFLILGQGAMIFFPDYRVHFLHVILVSGLGLMTFMIATRVSLAHGQHNMKQEVSSKGLFIGALLMALAGLTRLSAGLLPQSYQSHLVYAAYTWVLGLIVWGYVFLPKILKTQSGSMEQC